MKKILPCLLLILNLATVRADGTHSVAAAGALPGTGHIMIEVGYRYGVFYHAAKQNKWDFATYQLEELEEALERLAHLKPKHATNIAHFQAVSIPPLRQALAAQNWQKFEAGFEKMRTECMACHGKNEVGFIVLTVPPQQFSPVLE
jgi:hypothetical protein